MVKGKKKLKKINALIDAILRRRVALRIILRKAKVNGEMADAQKMNAVALTNKINKAKADLKQHGIKADNLCELKKTRQKTGISQKRWLRGRRKSSGFGVYGLPRSLKFWK